MPDGDFQIDVNVTGAEAAAGKLNTVADAEVLLAQRAAAQNDLAEAATRVSGKQTEALKDVAQAADTVAGSSANTAKSAAGMAWEFARTEEMGRGLSMMMNGQMAYGTRYLATGFRGLFELLENNPMLAFGAVLLATIPAIDQYLSGRKQAVEAANKELAENTEQMGKRMEEALKHPGMAEWGLMVKGIYDDIADSQQRVVDNQNKIQAAQDKYAESVAKQRLAQLDADEKEDIAKLRVAGASENDIAKTRAYYASQRTLLTGQNDRQAAAREVADKQKDLTDAQAALATRQEEKDQIEKTLREHQQAAQASQTQSVENFMRGRDQDQARLDDLNQKVENFAATGGSFHDFEMLKGQRDELSADMEARRLAFANQQKAAEASQGATSGEDKKKLGDASANLDKAAANLEIALYNLATAKNNAATVGMTAEANRNEQSGKDAEFNRTQKGSDLANWALAGAVAAAQSKTGNWGGVSSLLGKIMDSAQRERDNPTEQNLKDLTEALIALDQARQIQTGKLQQRLENLIAQVQQLASQTANNRNRGSGFN